MPLFTYNANNLYYTYQLVAKTLNLQCRPSMDVKYMKIHNTRYNWTNLNTQTENYSSVVTDFVPVHYNKHPRVIACRSFDYGDFNLNSKFPQPIRNRELFPLLMCTVTKRSLSLCQRVTSSCRQTCELLHDRSEFSGLTRPFSICLSVLLSICCLLYTSRCV